MAMQGVGQCDALRPFRQRMLAHRRGFDQLAPGAWRVAYSPVVVNHPHMAHVSTHPRRDKHVCLLQLLLLLDVKTIRCWYNEYSLLHLSLGFQRTPNTTPTSLA